MILNSIAEASIRIMNKRLTTDPWCIPSITSLNEPFTYTLDSALLYIALTKWMTDSSTPSFLKHLSLSFPSYYSTFWGTLSEAFSRSTKAALSFQVMLLLHLSKNKDPISGTATWYEPKLPAVNIYLLSYDGINNRIFIVYSSNVKPRGQLPQLVASPFPLKYFMIVECS